MAEPGATAKKPEPVVYDGDQKLLAFLGAAAFVLGALFWALLAVRFWGTNSAALIAAAMAPACAIAFLMAWRLRAKMEASLPVTRWEVRRLLIAGFVLGVVLGALPYLTLRFKLEDPDVLHVASEPANLPPAWR